MEQTHECKENETLNHIGEWKMYKRSGEWWLSADDGGAYTDIKYCPFCGTKLD